MNNVNIALLVITLLYYNDVECTTCTLEESTSTWPECTQEGVDWSGDVLLDGLRFSKQACAEWCETMGSRCAGWVYKDIGTWCHLKYIKGRGRNMNSPLTTEDITKIEADCKVNPPTTTAAPSSSNNASSDNATSSSASTTTASSNASDTSASSGTNLCDYSANETWYISPS